MIARAPEPVRRHEFTQVHMGLPVRMIVHAGETAAAEAAPAAFARIAALEHIFSDYRSDSEIVRLAARPREWVPVSAELFEVLRIALEVAESTEGAFDPTVGPLVALWREARQTRRLPPTAAIDAARARVGWTRVQLDPVRQAVRLGADGMTLDVGGVAKGYILQQAIAALAERGVRSALIEAGGDIAAGAPPPTQRKGWHVAVPGAQPTFAARAERLRGASLATSGPTSQFVDIDGVRYSHVVDPRTGVGVTHDTIAHVIATDGALADALATALTVLGAEAVPRILSRYPEVAVQLTEARQ